MSKPQSRHIAVDAGLVGQTIVEAMFNKVDERPAPEPPDPIGAALEDPFLSLVSHTEGRVEMQMRRAGYLARVVEAEMFEPAKQSANWLVPMMHEHFAETEDWDAAILAACAKLARAEPVGKPHPEDAAAATWRVPGPGGHVRHFLARRTIEERLQGRDRPFDGDPADLKIPWVYGFFLRACEEVLPHEAQVSD